MLKRTIEYPDYNGNMRKEDFYFNLTKAELAEMNLSIAGGMAKMIEDLVSAQDAPKAAAIFKDIILRSYGVKSPDGKRFIKSKALSEEFMQTEAYSILYMELLTDDTAKAAATFINGILPNDISSDKRIEAEIKKLTQ